MHYRLASLTKSSSAATADRTMLPTCPDTSRPNFVVPKCLAAELSGSHSGFSATVDFEMKLNIAI